MIKLLNLMAFGLLALVTCGVADTQVVSAPTPIYAIADPVQYVQPSAGATVLINGSSSLLIVDNPSLLLTLTVSMPSNPVDGQRVIVTSGAGVTALTINGGTVKGLITSLSLNGYARFAYSANANAWFRTG